MQLMPSIGLRASRASTSSYTRFVSILTVIAAGVMPAMALKADDLLPQGSFTLNLSQPDPALQFFYAVESATLTAANAEDDWQFNAEAGDELDVRVEGAGPGQRINVRVLNTAGTQLTSVNGTAGQVVQLTSFAFSAPGSYRLRVLSPDAGLSYALRATLNRSPVEVEVEKNDTVATANRLVDAIPEPGGYRLRAAGALDAEDADGDLYALGWLQAGDSVNPFLDPFPGSPFAIEDMEVRLLDSSGASLHAFDGSGSTAHMLTADADYWLAVRPINATGNALSFEQGTDVVMLPEAALDGQLDVTLQFWWRTAATRNQAVISGANPSNNNAILVWYTGSALGLYAGTNANAWVSWNTGSLSDDRWRHFTFVRDANNNQIELFINGVSQGVQSLTMDAFVISEGGLMLGQEQDSVGGNLDVNQSLVGKLDDFRIWHRALSPAEVAANWNTVLGGAEVGLGAWWRFDAASGDTVIDSGPAGLDGTLGRVDLTAPVRVESYIPLDFPGALEGMYRMDVVVGDVQAPAVVSTTLADLSAAADPLVRAFDISFSEELAAATANDLASYELVWSGPDGVLDTADDFQYPLAAPGYTDGTQLTLQLANGSLQPGEHRLTVSTAITDRAANPMAADYIEVFTIQRLGQFANELPGNNSIGTAQSVSLESPGAFNGTFSGGGTSFSTAETERIRAADLFGNGLQDVVTLHRSGAQVQVWLNDGNGGFEAPQQLATQSNPWDLQLADLDGDGRVDIIVSNRNSHTLTLFRAQSDGSFVTEHVATGGNTPCEIHVADLNADNSPDLVVALRGPNGFATFLNDGTGALGTPIFTALPSGSSPEAITVGDFDNDGFPDVALAAITGAQVHVYWGSATTYVVPDAADYPSVSSFAGVSNMVSIAAGDINGDGLDDIAIATSTWDQLAHILYAEPSRAFATEVVSVTAHYSSGWATEIQVSDIDGDGFADIRISKYYGVGVVYGGVELSRFLGYGSTVSYSTAVADMDLDGLPDLLAGFGSSGRFVIYPGQAGRPLFESPLSSGIYHGFGRGRLSPEQTEDWWSFDAVAGQRMIFSTETIDSNSGAGLNYRLYLPDGSLYWNNTASSNGQLHRATGALPVSGTYTVRVAPNWNYYGEYRFHVMLAPQPWLAESESNDSTGAAQGAQLVLQSQGERSSSIFGKRLRFDGDDYYVLGFLSSGTQIEAAIETPFFAADYLPQLSVFKGSSSVLDESPGVVAINYTVPAEGGDTYYVRVSGAPKALLTAYLLQIDLTDNLAPIITGDTLPAMVDVNGDGSVMEPGMVDDLLHRFTLTVNKDLDAATVNDAAVYDLRASGADGLFDTSDDILFEVSVGSAYSSGATISLEIVDGPLPAGDYRFQVLPTLADRSGNTLAQPYERFFGITAISPFVLENRDNNSYLGATLLGAPGAFSGTFNPNYLGLATEANNHRVRAADVNGDGLADLLVLQRDQNRVRMYLNAGDGSFDAPIDIPTGSNPWDLQVAHFNADGRIDFVVSNRNSHTLSVYLNQGGSSFTETVVAAGGNNPCDIAIADLNGDGHPDIAVALRGANATGIYLNNGFGAFASAIVLPGPSGFSAPEAITVGDFDNDGHRDIAIAAIGSNQTAVYWGGSGVFATPGLAEYGEPSVLTGVTNPVSIAAGDIDGDGYDDLVLLSSSWEAAVYYYPGSGDRDFGDVESRQIADSNGTGYEVRVADINGDGFADIMAARYYGLGIMYGGPSFGSRLVYGSTITFSSDLADMDGDGVVDLVVANYNNNRIEIYPSQRFVASVEDPVASDVRHYYGRGHLRNNDDIDVFAFEGRVGERVQLSVRSRTASSSAGLNWRIMDPSGRQLTSFNASSNGTGQNGPLILPMDGTYFVRIAVNWGYHQEYQFRLSRVPAPWRLETEGNDSLSAGNSNPLMFDTSGPAPVAHSFGSLLRFDTIDYYSLGNVSPGTSLRFEVTLPDLNETDFTVEVHLSGTGRVGQFPVIGQSGDFTFAVDTAGQYYLAMAGSPQGLFSFYQVKTTLIDSVPPEIVADTLPEEGSDFSGLFDRWTLTFSEEMVAATVNNPANYALRGAGPDGVLDTGDDDIYTIALRSNYSSGLSASFYITDGPLQPGPHRFTASTALEDPAGNALAAPYIRTFNVLNIDGFIVEGRGNSSHVTATPLSTLPPGDFDGSFNQARSQTVAAGYNPVRVRVADMDGDGLADLIGLDRSGARVGIHYADGLGGFAAAEFFPTQSNPWDLQVADLDGDGAMDFVVSNRNSHTISLFMADGFGDYPRTDLATGGNNPMELEVVDVDGDGRLDILTPLRAAQGLVIFRREADGSYSQQQLNDILPASSNPEGIATGDFNGDGITDIALALNSSSNIAVLFGSGGDNFSPAVLYPVGFSGGSSIAATDLDGDGLDDVVVGSSSWPGTAQALFGDVADGFTAGVSFSLGNGYSYEISFVDLPTHTVPYVVIARNSGGFLSTADGRALRAPLVYGSNVSSARVADINGDMVPDFVVANSSNGRFEIFEGNLEVVVPEDGTVPGMRHVFARGQRSTSSEDDYYSFSGRAGEVLMIASETPSGSGASGLNYFLHNGSEGAAQLFSFNGGWNGTGSFSPYILPYDGTYTIRVAAWYDFQGEYNFRVSLAPADWEMESENNDSAGSADGLALNLQPDGSLFSKVLGYLHAGDPRDNYALGTLSAGTRVVSSWTLPSFSAVVPTLSLVDASDQVVASTTGEGSANGIDFTIPEAAGGTYILSMAGDPRGLAQVYFMEASLLDEVAPAVVASSLPDDFASTAGLLDGFSLEFSETMAAGTVNNLANYDLRSAGEDAVFGTFDDTIVPIQLTTTYSSGITVNFLMPQGGLQPGFYRFTAGGTLQDLAGNTLLTAFERFFNVDQELDFTMEVETNGTRETATPITMEAVDAELETGGGRGRLRDNSDIDFWSFDALAGDRVVISAQPATPGGSRGLRYILYNPAGGQLADRYAESDGTAEFAPVTLAADGTYTVRVSVNWGYNGEYQMRITLIRDGIVIETEPNNTVGTATPLPLTPLAELGNAEGTAAGTVRLAGDLDYFAIGEVLAGSTLFLSARVPEGSPLLPIVAVYNASNQYQSEVIGGSINDGVAEVEITTTGEYYALVRASGTTHGFFSQYLLDVRVAPTGGLVFPNLSPVSLAAANGPFLSGDDLAVNFRIENTGSEATPSAQWFDRVLLSPSASLADPGNIVLETLLHNGALVSGAGYDVSTTLRLPDGMEGSYFVGLQTDATNLINEFLFEGDNVLFEADPIVVTRRDYPDLRIEDLVVTELPGSTFRIAWRTVNRGSADVSGTFEDRIRIRRSPQQTLEFEQTYDVATGLAVDAGLDRSIDFTPVGGGLFLVEVRTDVGNSIYEYNASGPVAAIQNNVGTTSFAITRFFDISLAVSPLGAGTASGGGSFPEGQPVTVIASPNTTVLPYAFAFWEENGIPRSTSAEYTFTPGANRSLTAVFRLPQFFVGASVSPGGAGSVGGTGFYEFGADAVLTANPQPGYFFDRWETGSGTSTDNPLTLNVDGARTVTAFFGESNPIHNATLATSPADVTVLPGAGTYNNGEVLAVTAPAAVEAGDIEYLFQRWRLNGQFYSNQNSFSHTFTTLEPLGMAWVAEYTQRSLRPTVSSAFGNRGGVIPAGFSYVITLQFDRVMDTTVAPAVQLLSGDSGSIPTFDGSGQWTSSSRYALPAVSFGEGQSGLYVLAVEGATDTQGRVMDPAQPFSFTVDVVPPAHPVPVLGDVTASSARFHWDGFVPAADMSFFRVYLEDSAFASLAGLEPISNLGANQRTVLLSGLSLDTPYHMFVAAVDTAGNMGTDVVSVPFQIDSEVPPPVEPQMTLLSTTSVALDWADYLLDGGPLGLDGFRVYAETAPYVDVSALTPLAELDGDTTTYTVSGLDRSVVSYLAVVGVNRLGQADTAVTPIVWSDPLSGTLTADFTFDEPPAVVSQSLVIDGGATLTITAGSKLAFASGARIEVQDGALVVAGSALEPVLFTSSVAHAGGTGARGQWSGVHLVGSADSSSLSHLIVEFGSGLRIDAGSPFMDTLGLVWNAGAGLDLRGTANADCSSALIAFNETGVALQGAASATISGAVIKNNTLGSVANSGSGTATFSGNWWGTASAATIAAGISGSVDSSAALTAEPVLTAALATADGNMVTGLNPLPLRLMSLNAESYRISEDSTFADAVFVDLPRPAGASGDYLVEAFEMLQPLSPEAGEKNIFVQFSSFSGELSDPVSLVIDYVTDGPAITAFNLAEGDVVNRPVMLNATAEATLGVQSMRFLVNGTQVLQSVGGSFQREWDIRSLTSGLYRVRLEAVDAAGNVAAREFNVVVQPLPPVAPVILSPVDGTVTNQPSVAVNGTAEPGITVRINRGPTVLGTAQANAFGQFSFANAGLREGSNLFIATAIDSVGETASLGATVVLSTRPPTGLELAAPTYEQGIGHTFEWSYLSSQDQPTLFRLFLNGSDFSDPASASFSSPLQPQMSFTLTPPQLSDGTYFAAVIGYDAAGNAGPLSARIQVVLDRTNPVLTLAFDQSSPVGPGNLGITLTSNEPLQGTPTLSLRPQGGTPVSIPLTAETATRFSGTYPVNELSARSGTAQFTAVARDGAGNRFSGSPSGPAIVFDVTRPVGTITTDPVTPVSVATEAVVEVTLALSKPPAIGEVPALSFIPPQGDTIVFDAGDGFSAITGDRQLWRGQMTLGPTNGNGIGNFTLSVEDAVGNVGTAINSGRDLELYNTALPTPPARPAGLSAQTLPGGEVRISWDAVSNAETYTIYRAAGDVLTPPTELLVAGLETTTYTDQPPADGIFSYVVTASRRGAEGLPSGILPALSDSTPPPAPEGFSAELTNAGVVITWTAPSSGEVPHRYRVYRNDTLIRTVTVAGTVSDSPPRGSMVYRVASVDPYGNEASSATSQIDLFVGAVTNLHVRLVAGNPPVLQWTRPDPTAVGVHIYRNGVRQTASPSSSLLYVDPFGVGNAPVEYAIRAVNAAGQESAPKSVLVYPVHMGLLTNPDNNGAQQTPLVGLHDNLRISVSNTATSGGSLSAQRVELERIMAGADPWSLARTLGIDLATGATQTVEVVQRAPSLPGVEQTLLVRVIDEDAVQGNTVTYQHSFSVAAAVRPASTASISMGSQPLAGGLTDFTLSFINRGYVTTDFVVATATGTEPGDLYFSVQTPDRMELSRVPYAGVPPGAIVRPNGDVVVSLEPGASFNVELADVLVPSALEATGAARFEAVASRIYHGYATANAEPSGPLVGSRESSLTLTPYVGIATTDQQLYTNSGPIQISGQALDRETGDPVANVPLKVGFSARGFQWFEDVMADENGDFSYAYEPQPGFSGTLRIWAAHPDVFDELDQVEVQYLRLYLTPARGNIVMSRSDTLDFSLTLINPGDIPLTNFTVESEAIIMDGENEVPISGLTADFADAGLSSLPANQRRSIRFRLTAALDVPDDPIIVITLRSSEGATTEFIGQVSLRPAVAILTVQNPTVGYVDVSVDRGQLVSREVTIINQGLRPLTNVRLTPPQNMDWFLVNLPLEADGTAALPDIAVGGERTFTVVFAPPEGVDLGFYDDSLVISGDNAQSDFTLNLFAQVTSNLTGSVQFVVNNIFGDRVPNARIRLRNADLRLEVGPFNTDALGEAVVEDLQEGDWSWQISAAGHSVQSGVVQIVPDQTAMVERTLNRSLVTVNFSVVPKPFTDRYEILIEQTFETRVPFPVLVLTPPHFEFSNPEPGFETVVIVQARNEGLIRMIDFEVKGSSAEYGDFTPLITFLPELGAQETVEIPFRLRFYGRGGGGSGASAAEYQPAGRFTDCLGTLFIPGSLSPDVMLGLAALANAAAESFSGALVALAGSVLVGFDIFSAISNLTNPLGVLAGVIGCAIGSFIGVGDGGGGGTGPGGGGGGYGFYGLGCFTGDTPVMMADGTPVAIEDILPGMVVVTDSFGQTAEVSELIERTSDNLFELTFSGPHGAPGDYSLLGTGEHRIWTDDSGWLALQELQPGQWLHHSDGSLRQVLELEPVPGPHTVYTLDVDADNAFFAGGILVQDNCGGLWLTADSASGVVDSASSNPETIDLP